MLDQLARLFARQKAQVKRLHVDEVIRPASSIY
jgi:hypothetical protein